MDGINPITQKSERNPITGTSDEFRSVADGFAALLQLTGNKTSIDSAASAAESELMRYDDKRDLVRDSHTLNDADANRDDRDNDAEVDEPDGDQDTRSADDDTESDGENAATDGENADDSAANGNGENAAAGNGETAGQPQVAGDGATADLGIVEGAAAAAGVAQVKTTVDAAVTQATTTQATQAAAVADTTTGQAGVQTQQASQNGVQQAAAVSGDQAERTFAPVETQVAQAATAAAQTQAATTQQTATQTNQTQAQQGQQVTQDRAQGQSTEVRSAAAQAQSQDLSKRLGDDTRARVQVTVTGPQAAQTSTEPGQFNRFVGYSAGDTRTVSTANGQAGMGTASNAAIANPDTPAERPATQTNAPIPSSATQPHTQAAQPGAPSSTAARADLAAATTRGDSALTQSGSGQSNAASTSAPQPTAQAAATQNGQTFAQSVQQTTGAERPPAPTSSQVIEQIKVNINKSVKAGLDRVTIQLRPENLGRIEVKMELSQDGKVRALVTAETKDTLDLLQRDARGLERALQDAGLRTDSNNLHFALKSEQNGKEGWSQKGENANAANDNGDDEGLSELDIEEQEYERATAAAARGGVDQLV